MSAVIDLNADVGEDCGDDDALLQVVTTANVAAGAHAGGGEVLERTVRHAAASSVAVGAHPSYPDRASFGRVSRSDVHDAASTADFVHRQVLVVASACAAASTAMTHVKAHGALYNDAAADEGIADAFLDGVRRAGADLGDPLLAVMGMPRSALHRACDRRGVPFLAEAFADRAYAPDGSLVARGVPGAVLGDIDAVLRQVLQIAVTHSVTAVDGSRLPMTAVTICLHGDTPGAVQAAHRVRAELQREGVRIASAVRPV